MRCASLPRLGWLPWCRGCLRRGRQSQWPAQSAPLATSHPQCGLTLTVESEVRRSSRCMPPRRKPLRIGPSLAKSSASSTASGPAIHGFARWPRIFSRRCSASGLRPADDGRPELASEIEAARPDLRAYVRDELIQLRAEPYFDYAVDGATAGYGPLGVDIALDGHVEGVKGGIRNTFEAVPDAPVTKFTLEMQGGNKGLLENSTNLCARPHRATADFVGHNGKVDDFKPLLAVKCGKKGHKKSH